MEVQLLAQSSLTEPFTVTGARLTVPVRGGKVAVIADVHGNLPALEACLAEIGARGAAAVLCAGDVVGYGPWPGACVDVLREAGVVTVRGNYDTGAGLLLQDCGCAYPTPREQETGAISLGWTQAVLTPNQREWLAALPDLATVTTPGGRPLAVVFHGSPRRVNEYLYEDRPETSLARLMASEPAPVAVFGHTHLPYRRMLGPDRLLVNCGSTGRPKHGHPLACYAWLEWPEQLADRPDADVVGALPSVEIRQVPYDHARTARAITACGLPDDFARLILTGGAR